jgi:hypothetical protein
MTNDQDTISVDDTVYFESADDPNIRIKANFRGWSGSLGCVVYNHGHQIMIERSRIFKTDIPGKENKK